MVSWSSLMQMNLKFFDVLEHETNFVFRIAEGERRKKFQS